MDLGSRLSLKIVCAMLRIRIGVVHKKHQTKVTLSSV